MMLNIQDALDYVEKNLTEQINPDSVAQVAGYSRFHFQRVFKAITTMNLGAYIRMRRLNESAREITESNCRIIDAAFKYGFESQEAYTRAFQKQFGHTPGRLRKNKSARWIIGKPIKLSQIITIEGKPMRPEFKDFREFEVIGLTKKYNSENKQEIPELWQEFVGQIANVPYCCVEKGPSFGVCRADLKSVDTQITNCDEIEFFYTAAVEKSAFLENIPQEFEVIKIPAKTYAVFPCSLSKIAQTYAYIYSTWLQSSEYAPDGELDFEMYGSEFLCSDPESLFHIYIPVKKK